jgi:hypothetical protein
MSTPEVRDASGTFTRVLGGVEIRAIKVRDLDAFARESRADAQPGHVAPISESRALAQMRNPHASPDDVGLLVAYRDGRCIGTLNVIPGLLRRSDGRLETVHWLSAWYVHGEHRNTGAGALQMYAALQLGRPLASSDFAPAAARAFKAMRFQWIGPLRYAVIDLRRFNLFGLPFRAAAKLVRMARPGTGGNTVFDRVARLAGRPTAAVCRIWLSDAASSDLRPYRARRLKSVAGIPAADPATRDAREPVRFYRDPAIIDWMLNHHWVVTDPAKATPNYQFRDTFDAFDFVALEVTARDDGRSLGFVVFRHDALHGRRTVTVVDHYFLNAADARSVLPLALGEARSFGADQLVLPPICLDSGGRSWRIRPFIRAAERQYGVRLPSRDPALESDLRAIALDLSDGEACFAGFH